MPLTVASSELRNRYNEISNICHEKNEPIYITKNGNGDLAVMSIETYENIIEHVKLMLELEKGFDDIKNGKVYSMEQTLKELKMIK